MNAADGPSDNEEEEKDAKRQRSAPTTPRSTSSILPHEYDGVMGITQVEPRDAETFEEGDDSDFQDAEETATSEKTESEARGPGETHGGIGSATLRACIEIERERARQQSTVTPAALHSGEGTEKSAEPPQKMIGADLCLNPAGRGISPSSSLVIPSSLFLCFLRFPSSSSGSVIEIHSCFLILLNFWIFIAV